MTAQPADDSTTAVAPQTQAVIAAAIAAALAAQGNGITLAPITVSAMVAKTLAGIRTDTKRTYKSYLELLVNGWSDETSGFAYPGIADMQIADVRPSHLNTALDAVQVRAEARIAGRNAVRRELNRKEFADVGATPRYNAIGAFRRLFNDAIAERHLAKGANPADDIKKPHRSEGTRLALTQEHLDAAWELIDSTGDDPELDRMLCETILVTGARVEGLLNLQLRYLDADEAVVWLDEKFDRIVAQPAPGWFVDKLIAFARERGAVDGRDKVFVKRAVGKRPAAPITDRRMDYIFGRLQAAYEWADRDQVSAHVLRHHAITVVERFAGKAVARAFARHTSAEVNDIYTAAKPT